MLTKRLRRRSWEWGDSQVQYHQTPSCRRMLTGAGDGPPSDPGARPPGWFDHNTWDPPDSRCTRQSSRRRWHTGGRLRGPRPYPAWPQDTRGPSSGCRWSHGGSFVESMTSIVYISAVAPPSVSVGAPAAIMTWPVSLASSG